MKKDHNDETIILFWVVTIIFMMKMIYDDDGLTTDDVDFFYTKAYSYRVDERWSLAERLRCIYNWDPIDSFQQSFERNKQSQAFLHTSKSLTELFMVAI